MIAWPWLAVAVHGLRLAALACVIGGLVVEALIPAADTPEAAVARRRLRRFITGCLVALMLLSGADLVVRAREMSRASLGGAIAALPDVLRRTHFGAIWIARSLVLALATLLSLARGGRLRAACLFLALAAAFTQSLTGHAADRGDLTIGVAVDWAHAVAASAWTGGLLALALVVLGGMPPWSPALVAALARRFSRLAGVCAVAVVLTGAYNAWSQVGEAAALWTTTYGRVLTVKLLIVAALAGIGAVNRYVVLPRLDPAARHRGVGVRAARLVRLALIGRPSGASDMPRRLAAYVAWEAALAAAVFASTAVLGEATPGRHALLERRPKMHVTVRTVREVPDLPKGWVLTPPSGDTARGREVFVRLACFECHAVGRERFPAPRRPGPDLTDSGRRHPGYLVEAIMNPDALIVDGPGYTDPDGSSTMPDYRTRLTVGELIDLVAYLKSLGGSLTRDPR